VVGEAMCSNPLKVQSPIIMFGKEMSRRKVFNFQ
jgi:hypothetical protein